jgi:hypothetical protein
MFSAVTDAVATPLTPHRDGMLLLLSALALGTVAVASSSLLRLLRRMSNGL